MINQVLDFFHYMDLFGFIIFAFISILGLIAAGWILYGIFWIFTPYKKPFKIKAKVKNLSYSPSKSFTGVGAASNGGVATTFGSTSESYNVILKLEDDDSWNIDDEDLFNDVEVGDKLLLTARIKTIWGTDNWDLVSYSKIS